MDNKFRLAEKNKVLSEIKLVESLIKRSRETLDRVKGQDDSVFTRTQISKLSDVITENENKLAALQQKQIDISAGKFDDEIRIENANVLSKIHKKEEFTNKKKKDKEDEKKNDSDLLKKHYEKTNRYEFSESFWEKEERRYYKNCDSLPQWIRDKLKDMPCNKGYIWRDLWFFGEKYAPFTKNCTMFENLKGGITIIHEIDADYHKIYEKVGRNNNKTLIEKIKRNKF
jgi:hypothetical protein